MITLPDCGAWESGLELTPEEKRELIVRIANDGLQAIDAFIAEREAKDSTIGRKIARVREELARRAQALKEALERGFDERRGKMRDAWEQAFARLEGKASDQASRLRLVHDTRDAVLLQALEGLDIVQLAVHVEEIRGFKKLRILLLRFLHWLWRLLTAPFRLLARGSRKEQESRRRRLYALFPGKGALSMSLDALSASILANPALRDKLRSRLKAMGSAERMRFLWRRMLGLEDYGTLAMKLMEEALKQKERELTAEEEGMARNLQDLIAEKDSSRRKHEKELEELWTKREAELRQLAERLKSAPREKVRTELISALEDAGLVRQDGGEVRMTRQLIDRFSEIVYTEEMKALQGGRHSSLGTYNEGEGVFNKERLLSVYELSRMDLVESLIHARTHHPHVRHIFDDDVLVYREWATSATHVVIVFDRSGSMEENKRLDAAKRAVFVVHRAAKLDNRDNRVDVIEMETSVKRVDLLDAWVSTPKGFTNTGGALQLAAELLESSRADRKLVYLITDGLPEAMTKEGQDFAAQPDRCLDYALKQARKLARLKPGFAIVLLEAEDEMFVDAAEQIAAELKGKVIKTDPRKLVKEVYLAFDEAMAKVKEEPARARA